MLLNPPATQTSAIKAALAREQQQSPHKGGQGAAVAAAPEAAPEEVVLYMGIIDILQVWKVWEALGTAGCARHLLLSLRILSLCPMHIPCDIAQDNWAVAPAQAPAHTLPPLHTCSLKLVAHPAVHLPQDYNTRKL